jgi:malate dehydrogenase (oxaloacetate-decarboxylating)
LACAAAIAAVVGADELSPEYIIPSVFDTRVVEAVSAAAKTAAIESGVARKTAGADDMPTQRPQGY